MKNFRFALGRVTPIAFSYIFIGVAFGMLMKEAGYGPLWAVAASVFIYAGSMQIVMVTLITSGAPLYLVAAMTLLVNARHVFYGLGFVERFRRIGGWRRWYMILAMTDEAYSLLCEEAKYPPEVDPDRADFLTMALCHMWWVLGSALGGLLGSALPFDASGIEFSATAFFAVVVVNQWMSAKSHVPALVGLVSAAVFLFALGPEGFLLPALSASVVALVLLRGWGKGALRNA